MLRSAERFTYFSSIRHRSSERFRGKRLHRDLPHPEVAETSGQGRHLQAGVRLQRWPGRGGGGPSLSDQLRPAQPDSWDELHPHSGCREGPQEEHTCHLTCIHRWVGNSFTTMSCLQRGFKLICHAKYAVMSLTISSVSSSVQLFRFCSIIVYIFNCKSIRPFIARAY